MNSQRKQDSNIRICMGPGCKAWGAKGILRRIRSGGSASKMSMCTSPCMNRCGGGTAVSFGKEHQVIKFKTVQEAVLGFQENVPEAFQFSQAI